MSFKVGDKVLRGKIKGVVVAVVGPRECPQCVVEEARAHRAEDRKGINYGHTEREKRPDVSCVVREGNKLQWPAFGDLKLAAAQPAKPAFAVGDNVRWTSQAGGYKKTKLGKIVVVVPPSTRARDVLVGSVYNAREGCFDGFSKRFTESYIVSTGRTLYWPRVCQLEKMDETGPVKSVAIKSVNPPTKKEQLAVIANLLRDLRNQYVSVVANTPFVPDVLLAVIWHLESEAKK